MQCTSFIIIQILPSPQDSPPRLRTCSCECVQLPIFRADLTLEGGKDIGELRLSMPQGSLAVIRLRVDSTNMPAKKRPLDDSLVMPRLIESCDIDNLILKKRSRDALEMRSSDTELIM